MTIAFFIIVRAILYYLTALTLKCTNLYINIIFLTLIAMIAIIGINNTKNNFI